jgi:hypothetical protein
VFSSYSSALGEGNKEVTTKRLLRKLWDDGKTDEFMDMLTHP